MPNGVTRRAGALLALITLSLPLHASKQYEKMTPCDPWSGPCWDISSFAVYQDDCGGPPYAIFIRCDCGMEVHYLRTIPIGGLHTPPSWEYVWAQRDFSTPGADCNIHLIDDTGREIRFRNPYNSAEATATMNHHQKVEVQGGSCDGDTLG
jgi:hypothetical protein